MLTVSNLPRNGRRLHPRSTAQTVGSAGHQPYSSGMSIAFGHWMSGTRFRFGSVVHHLRRPVRE